MASVVLTFVPVAEYVRTARLVAVAVARRAGVPEDRLDDIRLAVGEVCARAVSRCRTVRCALTSRGVVEVEIHDLGPVFQVWVRDPAGSRDQAGGSVALAMAEALADEIELADEGRNAAEVWMAWRRTGPMR